MQNWGSISNQHGTKLVSLTQILIWQSGKTWKIPAMQWFLPVKGGGGGYNPYPLTSLKTILDHLRWAGGKWIPSKSNRNFVDEKCLGGRGVQVLVKFCCWGFPSLPLGVRVFNFQCLLAPTGALYIIVSPLDHSNPSNPSHRLTNGPKPSKTIESDGSRTKNHWKTIDGNGQTAKKHSMVMVL